MNQEKIGAFIAERRKAVGLTQALLAEKLGITDRAVSKWERGKALPDPSIMVELCAILKISVTELLYGEVLSMDEKMNQKAEEQLLEFAKEKKEYTKKLLATEIVIGLLSILILLAFCVFAILLNVPEWQQAVIVLAGLAICLVGLFFAMEIEQTAGFYECQKCHHRYVPASRFAFWFSMHLGRTRYLKCPKCHKYSWNKKVLEEKNEK